MKRYLLAFTLAFLVTVPFGLVASSFRSADVQLLRKAFEVHHPAIYVLGNSVIDHSSKCDADGRSIAQMLDAIVHQDVVDVSKGGMQFAEFTDVVSVLAARQKVDALVVPLVPDMTDDAFWFRNEDIFRHAGYAVAAGHLPARLSDLASVNRPRNIDDEAQVYEGKRYGSVKVIQTRFMAKEKAASTCPEVDAADMGFFRYAYWRQASRVGPSHRFAAELRKLNQIAVDHHWPVIYILMPLNMDGYAHVNDPQVMQKILTTRSWMASQLRNLNADVIDLTESAAQLDFVDRWCACGHMGENGRALVAKAIANRLQVSH